jgi:hypothetical protein
VQGHITSLNPIRPTNAADDWEKEALKVIEKGGDEVSSVETIQGEAFMRLMRPLVTEKGCLKCHAAQGYKERDIRGGISVSAPMNLLWTSARNNMETSVFGHAVLWFLGNCLVIWKPRDVIGGDFFWCESTDDGFAVAVADCTGHGVPGAFMTAIASTMLRRVVHDMGIANPALVLSELNRLVKTTLNQHSADSKSNDGLDIGMCFVPNDLKTLVFSGAGMKLYQTAGDRLKRISGDRQSIGYRSSSIDHRYANITVPLDSPMNFYMTTDGLTHQTGGEKGLPFGGRRFALFLGEHARKPFDIQEALLEKRFSEYKGDEPQLDDVTVLGFAVVPLS